MNTTAIPITALLGLSDVGLATWAWFAMTGTKAQRRSLCGFEGLHFETRPQAAITLKGNPWPIPG